MIDVIAAAATSVGRVRRVNEDAVLARYPFFLVADGMGGHSAGDVASAIIVEEFALIGQQASMTANDVLDILTRSDDRIRAAGGGGSTVAGVATVEHGGAAYWLVFNLGDSRVYLRDSGRLAQVTVDHSVVQELIDSGELDVAAARTHPQRHVITRAVGAPERPNPDFWLIPAKAGDRAVMCSDGLTTEVDEDDIARLAVDIETPQELADLLVSTAVESGGHDNVSVVVVDIRETQNSHLSADQSVVTDDDESSAEHTVPRLAVYDRER